MTDIKIREIRKSDIEDIHKLHLTRDDIPQPHGASERTEMFKWLAFNNPNSKDEPTYFVAEDQGRVIAYHGRMPTEFNFYGERIKGYYVHDLYVDPEYRRKGKGFWLTQSLAKKIEQDSDSFFCLYGMTALNLQMHRRRKYTETFAQRYIKPLNLLSEIRKIIKNKFAAKLISLPVKIILYAIDSALLFIHKRKVDLIKVERFDSRFDDLNAQIQKKIGFSSYKSSSFLNWKYIDRPYRRDVVFASFKSGQLTGYIILAFSPYRSEYPQGIVIDLMADPEDSDSISMLCREAICYFRKMKADTIVAIFSDRRFTSVFKKYLFIPNSGKNVMLGNLDKCSIDDEKITDMNNWYMTRGESDGFMLLN